MTDHTTTVKLYDFSVYLRRHQIYICTTAVKIYDFSVYLRRHKIYIFEIFWKRVS